jgi:hypothetical protein
VPSKHQVGGSIPSGIAITLQKGPLTLRVQSRKVKNPHKSVSIERLKGLAPGKPCGGSMHQSEKVPEPLGKNLRPVDER